MRSYTKTYQGATIEVWKSEEQEYVQKGQFCYYRKANDWNVKVNGKFIDRGFGTKRSALAYGEKTIDQAAA